MSNLTASIECYSTLSKQLRESFSEMDDLPENATVAAVDGIRSKIATHFADLYACQKGLQKAGLWKKETLGNLFVKYESVRSEARTKVAQLWDRIDILRGQKPKEKEVFFDDSPASDTDSTTSVIDGIQRSLSHCQKRRAHGT